MLETIRHTPTRRLHPATSGTAMFKRERPLSALPVANLSRTFELKKRCTAARFATALLLPGQKQLRGQLRGNLREGCVFPLALVPENKARFPGSKAGRTAEA